ncbi:MULTISPECIES: bacteriocin immunity protein [Vagococcus]|uniref:Bacteriocin immunity protein n=1 Tax=Vagococcus fluvialis bH819 TaxID=1255619 RepID=A0A1X6WSH6_9ENTE|nr:MULTISPECIES: bacteriocin immunity protein [Vagococcus]SLM87217.1 hypothetical protein FM121_14045 [Vagococcus fluvialis bH819]
MGGLNWFTNDNNRMEQALFLIVELLIDVNHSQENEALKSILMEYKEVLANSNSSEIFILNQMTNDISMAIEKDNVSLSEYQTQKMRHLIRISKTKGVSFVEK